jgi:hypothetical protein
MLKVAFLESIIASRYGAYCDMFLRSLLHYTAGKTIKLCGLSGLSAINLLAIVVLGSQAYTSFKNS